MECGALSGQRPTGYVLTDCEMEPDVFGPWVHVLYLAHRRRTRKVRVFIEMLEVCLREKGIA